MGTYRKSSLQHSTVLWCGQQQQQNPKKNMWLFVQEEATQIATNLIPVLHSRVRRKKTLTLFSTSVWISPASIPSKSLVQLETSFVPNGNPFTWDQCIACWLQFVSEHKKYLCQFLWVWKVKRPAEGGNKELWTSIVPSTGSHGIWSNLLNKIFLKGGSNTPG